MQGGQHRPVLWEHTISGSTDDGVQSRASCTGQAPAVGKMILVSARDKMKRTGRCRNMHDAQCGDSSGYLARRIQRMDESGSVRRNKTTGSGRECRVQSQGYTISLRVKKIHSKEVRSARKGTTANSHVQISCARSTREDEGHLQIVTSKKNGSCRQK